MGNAEVGIRVAELITHSRESWGNNIINGSFQELPSLL